MNAQPARPLAKDATRCCRHVQPAAATRVLLVDDVNGNRFVTPLCDDCQPVSGTVVSEKRFVR